MYKIAAWWVALIALFLILDKYVGFTAVFSSLTDGILKGTAVLQGRDVKGVTK